MRTYYDPEDDTCEKSDRYERLLDLADHLRDEAKDREMEESYNTFTASSDAGGTPPVAMLPAGPPSTFTGELGGEAAGGYTFDDTEDDIRTPSEAESAAYRAAGVEYAQTARALLTRCFNKMSGQEINACQIATGDYDTDEGFRAHLLDSLAIQYSKEISEHITNNNRP